MPPLVELTEQFLRPAIGSALRRLLQGRTPQQAADYLATAPAYAWMTAQQRSQALEYAMGARAATSAARRQHLGGTVGQGPETVGVRLYVQLEYVDAAGNPIGRSAEGRDITVNVPGNIRWQNLLEYVQEHVQDVAFEGKYNNRYRARIVAPPGGFRASDVIKQVLPYGLDNPLFTLEIPF